jgi:uncharacterized protein YdgA (DUF945 family)
VNRRTGIALIVVIVVLAYPAAAWLIGITAQHQWEQREQQVSRRYPYFKIVKEDYHRGVYSSTQEITYSLSGPLSKALAHGSAGLAPGSAGLAQGSPGVAPGSAGLQSAPGSTSGTDLQITVRHTIHHGPLPQLRAFAPAVVDTELVLPPETRQKLVAVFGDKASLTIRTRLHWLGGTTTTLHSSAFERTTPDGVTFTWRGLDGTGELGSDLNSIKADFTAPGLLVKSAPGTVSLQDLRLTVDQRAAFDGIYVGPMSLTLGSIDVEQATTGKKVLLQKIGIAGASSVQGEFIDMDARIDADSLQIQQYALTHAGYEFRATHLHGPSLSALNKSFIAQQANGSGDTPELTNLQAALRSNGIDILVRDPVLEIPRLGFSMPEGTLLISLKASAPGLTHEEVVGSPDALRMALMKHLQASADFRIDTALLDKLLEINGKSDKIGAQLQGLQRQGYLKFDGKALTTHLTFAGGQLKVNDQPFPAIGAGPPPPPGGHP